MPVLLQWVTVIIIILLVYFGYIHGAIRHMRSYKIQIGMTEKDVKKLIGSPVKTYKNGHRVEAIYKFHYANRMSACTDVKLRVHFDRGKVTHIY